MIFNVTDGGGGTGATLAVTAPAGCTVTISRDGKAKTKTAGADGLAVFQGLATGEWTLTITDGGQTASKVVTVTADYAVSITFFAATINVTYPAGSICTATDGVTTLTAPNASGTWACVVPNVGDWVVTLDSGFRETATITDNGQTVTIDEWYLYNRGDKHTEVTGGWKTAAWVSVANDPTEIGKAPTVKYGETYVEITETKGSACSSGIFEPVNKIDLTNVKTIRFGIISITASTTAHTQVRVGVFNRSANHYNYIAVAAPSLNTTNVHFDVDVSSISGLQSVGVWVRALETLTVSLSEIKLIME